MMSQALHLMNAPELEAKISSADGRVAGLIERGASGSEIIEELCLSALGRIPGEREREVALDLFAAAPPKQAAEALGVGVGQAVPDGNFSLRSKSGTA
jgi:hypothetical protein